MRKRVFAFAVSAALAFSMIPLAFAGEESTDQRLLVSDVPAGEAAQVESVNSTVAEQLLAMDSTEAMYAFMLELMDSDIDALLNLSKAEIAQIRDHVNAIDPEHDDADTQDLLDTLDVLPNGSTEESAYEMLAAASSIEEMWALISAEENAALVEAMSHYEIEEVRHKANGFYCHLEFPTDSETRCYDAIEDVLFELVSNLDMAATYAVNWPWTYTVASGKTVNATLTDDVKLTGVVTVKGTLNITANGNYSITRSSYNNFFKVDGGTLNITAADGKTITIKNGDGNTPAIDAVGGKLSLNNVKIDNCKNDSTNNSWGGAISFANAANATIENTTINKCVAGNGSALYFNTSSSGTITVRNCTITNNTATTGEYDGTIRTMGGTNCKLNIESCVIKDNTSGLNGGGVYWNARGTSAALSIVGTSDNPTVIENNYADNGGGIFLSGSAITIGNTKIVGNDAKHGGGICMQPYDVSNTSSGPGCTLTLNSGAQLLDNEATEFGGGIYMQIDGGSTTQGEKFTININDGSVVKGNSAPNGGGVAVTQTTGNAEYEPGANRKYHAYVNINGGMIEGNTASVNGGAIYVSRTKYGAAAYDLHVNIAGGEIASNRATENGGAIYVANDTANERSKVVVSGGTAKANTAVNGGAVYLSGGNFEMSGGTFDSNTVSNQGGGVYVDNGTYTMTGGVMTKNVADDRGGAAYVSGTFNMDGGVMSGNTSQLYGGAAYVKGAFNMTDGQMTGNNAASRGGAVYVVNGSFTIHDGDISGNESVNGGAAYVRNGTFNMNGGAITGNSASKNGGGIFVENDGNPSNVYMTAGVIGGNTAQSNGGAAYVKDGTFNMTGGTLGGVSAGNTALNGGAVYITGGDFTMISGTMSHNTATEKTAGAAEAGTEGYGGGVYAAGGDVIIGVEGCNGDGENHSVTYTSLPHPVVTENEAEFGGALAVAGGNVYVYCGDLVLNQSDNRGTGMNVFMTDDKSVLYHYMDSATIGEAEDHGMVSVGGTLNVEHSGGSLKIKIRYHSNDTDYTGNGVEIVWTGQAPNEYYLNLPYCPSDWKEAPTEDGYTFVGWAEHRVDSSDEAEIRDKSDYDSIGDPVKIEDKSGSGEGVIDFYAVWAPVLNHIAYTYSLDGENIVAVGAGDGMTDYGTAPTSYNFQLTSYELPLGDASRSGYAFVGWRMYASNKVISNWGMDAKSYEPTLIEQLPVMPVDEPIIADGVLKTMQNFGDITLVAVFEPLYGSLTISKQVEGSVDENQSFLFIISVDPDKEGMDNFTMEVALDGAETVTVDQLPVGKYTVSEKANWSWRYTPSGVVVANDASAVTSASEASFKLTVDGEDLTFSNEKTSALWLSGADLARNIFAAIASSNN